MYPNDTTCFENYLHIYFAEEAMSCQKLSWVFKLIQEVATH